MSGAHPPRPPAGPRRRGPRPARRRPPRRHQPQRVPAHPAGRRRLARPGGHHARPLLPHRRDADAPAVGFRRHDRPGRARAARARRHARQRAAGVRGRRALPVPHPPRRGPARAAHVPRRHRARALERRRVARAPAPRAGATRCRASVPASGRPPTSSRSQLLRSAPARGRSWRCFGFRSVRCGSAASPSSVGEHQITHERRGPAMGEDGRVSSSATTASPNGTPDDPYLWLEEVTGDEALAWVRERNAETLAALDRRATRFAELRDGSARGARRRRPHPVRRDAGRARSTTSGRTPSTPAGCGGAPRSRATAPATPTGRCCSTSTRSPTAEDENWVWAGADRAATPTTTARLVQLSRGGADATVVREFDLAATAFVDRRVHAARGEEPTWAGSTTTPSSSAPTSGRARMTTSGYPRRGRAAGGAARPLAEAAVVFEGRRDRRRRRSRSHDQTAGFERDFVGRSPDFFTTEEYLLRPDGDAGAARRADDADVDVAPRAGCWSGPRSPWTVGGRRRTRPARCSCVDFDGFLAGDRRARGAVRARPAARSLSYRDLDAATT